MRIRNIKPDFFKDEDIAVLPFEARMLFIGLLTMADREGRLEYRPKRIKVELFPYDEIDVETICRKLDQPGIPGRPEKSFIHIYTVDGSEYIQILGFTKHQRPHHAEKPSQIPKPLKTHKTCESTSQDVQEPDKDVLKPLESGILNLESGDGKRSSEPSDLQGHAFQQFCAIYPKQGLQVGIQDGTAERVFRQEIVVADHGPLLSAARNYSASSRVKSGHVRDAINFIRDGYWRNWLKVEPSGSDPPYDTAWQKQAERDHAEAVKLKASGFKPLPPPWRRRDTGPEPDAPAAAESRGRTDGAGRGAVG